MTKKQKILACVGHVKRKSMAKLSGANEAYVSVILAEAGITTRQILGLS